MYGLAFQLSGKLLLLEIRHEIHSGYKAKAWEDICIPTFHARPVRPIVPVVHPRMIHSNFIRDDSKELYVEMLANVFSPQDIVLIKSLAISQTIHRDTYCRNFTKSRQYTVKSEN